MLSKITLSTAHLGSETAGSKLLWQAVIEETSFKAAGAVNTISYILWSSDVCLWNCIAAPVGVTFIKIWKEHLESDCLHQIRATGCSSAPRGR